jgi:hypothetical protein
MIHSFSDRELVVEVVNRLFICTDTRDWAALQNEVFTEEVAFDMSSVGGENMRTTSQNICDMWQKGFEGIDAINHLAGNFLVNINNENASVFAYATATHYKRAATHGATREFVGTYNLHLVRKEKGWRIDEFKYNLKYATGNLELN